MKHYLKAAVAAVAIVAASPSFAVVTSFNGAGFAIPATGVGTTGPGSSSVAVGNLGTINSITVSLNNFVHTWAGDLIATLSNGSTTITLFDRLGVPASGVGNGADFNGTYLFSAAGLQQLSENGALPGGTYLPAQSLAGFNGLNTAGTWTLKINDVEPQDVGSLGSWTLNIDSTAGAVPEPATWAMMIGGLGLVGLSMRRRKTAVSFA